MPEEKGLAFRVLVRIAEFNHPKSCPRKGYKGPTESLVPPEHRCEEAAFLRREVSLLNPGVISGAKSCRPVLSCSWDQPTPRAPARTRKRTSPAGQEPEEDTRCPASTTQGQAGSCQPRSQGTQHTKAKHAVSYPLPPFPWQTWGAHPPWDSGLSLRGEEKRQRRAVRWP